VLGVLLAVFVSGPKPVARPLMAAVKPAPQAIRTADKPDNPRPLDRLLQGWTVADAVPVFLKPDFNGGGPAAALCVKF
jgi:hypothetical protein